jgi:hypothetical protein
MLDVRYWILYTDKNNTQKIPSNSPLKKGRTSSPPFLKGDQGGFHIWNFIGDN